MPEYIILKRTQTPPDDSSTSWNTRWEQLPTAIQAVDRQAAVEAHLETLPEDERGEVFHPISVRDWGDSFSGQATVTWSAEPVYTYTVVGEADALDPPEVPEAPEDA